MKKTSKKKSAGLTLKQSSGTRSHRSSDHDASHETIASVWISKNAMTIGLFEVKNVRRCTWLDPKIIANGSRIFRHGEWHRTQKAALARAEDMRRDEVGKLAEKIDRIMKMKLL